MNLDEIEVGSPRGRAAPAVLSKSAPGGLVESLRSALEAEIAAGTLAPGMRVDVKTVAERFSVSRTPAREALLQLAAAGLIDYQPRRGGTVTRLSATQVLALSEVLIPLEAEAAKLAARRMSDDQRQALEAILRNGNEAAQAGDREAYAEANRKFHLAIYEGCGNPFLRAEIESLRRRTEVSHPISFQLPGRLRASNLEHAAIARAVCAGDEEAAADAARRHISIGGMAIAEFALKAANASLR